MTKKLALTSISIISFAVLCTAVWVVARNSSPDVEGARSLQRPPELRPDYSGVTLPANIAPLNFLVQEPGQRYVVHASATNGPDIEVVSTSPKIAIPEDAWRRLLQANLGEEVWFDVYVQRGNAWDRYQRVINHIASDEIDDYLVYRQIPPVHNKWREIMVRQRDLTGHRDTVIVNGMSFCNGCVNCHSFANNDPKRMIIGIRSREYGSAAILVRGGNPRRIESRFGYTAWHPSGQLAVYSINRVWQFFHTAAQEPRDVIDLNSALCYYQFNHDKTKPVPGAADKQRLETYPTWSPDGRFLYFCSAPRLWSSDTEIPPDRYAEVRYSLMRIAYDIGTDRWGDPEVLLSAETTQKSILLPRISPDGKFLLFCMCRYGCFPAYQPTSDLYLMNLDTEHYERLTINSEYSESWHSWSSNSRWIAFSSKRGGGPFTRCYLSHVDETGSPGKPFLVPQRDPAYYDSLLRTISVPELVTGPVQSSQEALLHAIRSRGKPTTDGLSGASGVATQSTIE